MKKKVKVLMIIFIPLVFFSLVYFIVGVLFWPAIVDYLSVSKNLGGEIYPVDELKNNTIVFPVNALATGKYDLQIYFLPRDSNVTLQLSEPINFELTVQIRHGKEIKEKKFTKIFREQNSRGILYLFGVPDDFFWSRKADIEITIKDIDFGEDFTQYFGKVSFNIMYFQLIAHNINIVDGERIYRDNGFKSW
jgi:hypothetical protein